jgi:hypothetical protein
MSTVLSIIPNFLFIKIKPFSQLYDIAKSGQFKCEISAEFSFNDTILIRPIMTFVRIFTNKLFCTDQYPISLKAAYENRIYVLLSDPIELSFGETNFRKYLYSVDHKFMYFPQQCSCLQIFSAQPTRL